MLVVRDLEVVLGARPVLNGVSFEVAPGELLGVIGPNGSGKSTLLRAICGLVPMKNGHIEWDGALLPCEGRERARVVSLLPQSVMNANGAELSVEELVMLGRTPHLPPFGTPSKRDETVVDEVLAEVAPDLRGRRFGELSGGQKQRVALARALATQAPLLLLDEPISALDLKFQHEILALVRRLTREKQLATICVLHGINLASLVADSLLLLDEAGNVVAAGAPERVMTREHLEAVYRVPLKIGAHPLSGRPQASTLWEF